jgi:hypothetical protein
MTAARKPRRAPQVDRTSVRIPCGKGERDAWAAAATRVERTLNGWIREQLNAAAKGKT